MRYRSIPWKRNFAKVPSVHLVKAAQIKSPMVLIAQTKMVPLTDLERGLYKHVGLLVEGGKISVHGPILPPSSSGKWSARNRDGWERPRHDLPKITKTYSWETPNFGDAATYGTHTTWREREVYPVEYDPPRLHEVAAEVLKIAEGTPTGVLIKFSVTSPIDKGDKAFDKELLWALNVLQENTGVAGIFPSDATRQDYLGTIALEWEVFPPGTAEEIIAIIRSRRATKVTKADTVMEERLKLFSALKPSAYLQGAAKFSSYIGAQFASDLVVFENVRYGNALYVLYDDWQEVSKRSRIDLLRGTSVRFDRFVHTDGWEDRFLDHMRSALEARSRKKTG